MKISAKVIPIRKYADIERPISPGYMIQALAAATSIQRFFQALTFNRDDPFESILFGFADRCARGVVVPIKVGVCGFIEWPESMLIDWRREYVLLW